MHHAPTDHRHARQPRSARTAFPHSRPAAPDCTCSCAICPQQRQPPGPATIALYVHGGTFPSALSIAHRFDGESWRDALCAAGFHTWGLDFHGFGALSDPYPEMADPADAHPPLGTRGQCQPAARTRPCVSSATIIARRAISLIAHSWGTHGCRASRRALPGPGRSHGVLRRHRVAPARRRHPRNCRHGG